MESMTVAETAILLVPHGGWHNDTIYTVEVKAENINPMQQLSLLDLPESIDEALLTQLEVLPKNFWDFKNADTRELTHGLHNYPAVMVYPISRNILKIIQSISHVDSLLDPFAGSGTVLVEGVVNGVPIIYGNDLNPLARLMSSVKTTPLSHKQLQELYNRLMMAVEYEMEMISEVRESIDDYITLQLGLNITAKDEWGSNAAEYINTYLSEKGSKLRVQNFKNAGYWYRPRVLLDLQIIKNCIDELPAGVERNFVLLVFSEVTRTVSNRRNGEFKMFRVKPEKILKFRPDVKREFQETFKRNIAKMAAFTDICGKKEINVTMLSENTMELNGVPDNSIDLMITSPPYGDSRTTVAYGEFSKLSLQWLGLEDISAEDISAIDKNLMGGKKYRNGFEYTLDSDTLRKSLDKIKDVDIERAGDVFSFYNDLDRAISAISKKMKKGGYQFWVVGNRTVKLENLQTDKILVELSKKHGLVHVYSIGRNIPNKVMPSLNSPTNVTGEKVATMTNEHIVIFRKK